MTQNALKNIKEEILSHRARGRKAAKTTKARVAWKTAARKDAIHALEPYARPLGEFLEKLAKELGLGFSGPDDGGPLSLDDGHRKNDGVRVAQQSFTLTSPKEVLEFHRDMEFTITLFAQYTLGEKGKAENIDVQLAWDNPKSRTPLSCEVESEMYGTRTTYFSFTHAVKSPRASQLEKALAAWIGKIAKDDKKLADKVLAADMPKLTLPAHKSRPAGGAPVKIYVSSYFEASPGLD